MILNVKLVGVLFVLLLVAAGGFFAHGDYVLFILSLAGLLALSDHMRRHNKYYQSEIDELYPDEKIE